MECTPSLYDGCWSEVISRNQPKLHRRRFASMLALSRQQTIHTQSLCIKKELIALPVYSALSIFIRRSLLVRGEKKLSSFLSSGKNYSQLNLYDSVYGMRNCMCAILHEQRKKKYRTRIVEENNAIFSVVLSQFWRITHRSLGICILYCLC